jgi:hypothetical protein
MSDQSNQTTLIPPGCVPASQILCRFVGPYDGGGHPDAGQGQSQPAPGGLNKPEGRSDG